MLRDRFQLAKELDCTMNSILENQIEEEEEKTDELNVSELEQVWKRVESSFRQGSQGKKAFSKMVAADLCGYEEGSTSSKENITLPVSTLIFRVALIHLRDCVNPDMVLRPVWFLNSQGVVEVFQENAPFWVFIPMYIKDSEIHEWVLSVVQKWIVDGFSAKNTSSDSIIIPAQTTPDSDVEERDMDVNDGTPSTNVSQVSTATEILECSESPRYIMKRFRHFQSQTHDIQGSLSLRSLLDAEAKLACLNHMDSELFQSHISVDVHAPPQIEIVKNGPFQPFHEKYIEFSFDVLIENLSASKFQFIRTQIESPCINPTFVLQPKVALPGEADTEKYVVSWDWFRCENDDSGRSLASMRKIQRDAIRKSKDISQAGVNFKRLLKQKLPSIFAHETNDNKISVDRIWRFLIDEFHFSMEQIAFAFDNVHCILEESNCWVSLEEFDKLCSNLNTCRIACVDSSDRSYLSDIDIAILGGLFPNSCNVQVRRLCGGFSGSMVLQTFSYDTDGRDQDSTVVKLDTAENINHEERIHSEMSQYIGNNAPVILGKYITGSEKSQIRGGLNMSLAGGQSLVPARAIPSEKYLITLKDLFLFEQQYVGSTILLQSSQDKVVAEYAQKSPVSPLLARIFTESEDTIEESKDPEDHQLRKLARSDKNRRLPIRGKHQHGFTIDTSSSESKIRSRLLEKYGLNSEQQQGVAVIHNIHSVLLEVFGSIFQRVTLQTSFTMNATSQSLADGIYDLPLTISKQVFSNAKKATSFVNICDMSLISEACVTIQDLFPANSLQELSEREHAGLFVDYMVKFDKWLQSDGKGIKIPVHQGIVHGDLNAANIVVDHTGSSWVLDFVHSGLGHVLQDLIKLLTCVILEYQDIKCEEQLHCAIRLIDFMSNTKTLSEKIPPEPTQYILEPISEAESSERVTQSRLLKVQLVWQTCRILREYMANYIQKCDDMRQYYCGMLFYSLKAMSFRDTSTFQKQLAIASVLIHANALMNFESNSRRSLQQHFANNADTAQPPLSKVTNKLLELNYVNKVALKCMHYFDSISQNVAYISNTVDIHVNCDNNMKTAATTVCGTPVRLRDRLQQIFHETTTPCRYTPASPTAESEENLTTRKRPKALQLDDVSLETNLNERNSRFFAKVKDLLKIDVVVQNRVAICGEPVSGKTILLKKIAMYAVEEQDFYTPVYVELNDLCKFLQREDAMKRVCNPSDSGAMTSKDKKGGMFWLSPHGTKPKQSPKSANHARNRSMNRNSSVRDDVQMGHMQFHTERVKSTMELSSSGSIFERYWASLYGTGSSTFKMLSEALEKKQIVFFFDGLDAMRSNTMKKLLEWLDQNSKLMVFITTRTEKLLKIQWHRFAFLRVSHLSANQIRELVENQVNQTSQDKDERAILTEQLHVECMKPVFRQIISGSPMLVNLVVFSLMKRKNKTLGTRSWSRSNILEHMIKHMIQSSAVQGNKVLRDSIKICASPLGMNFLECMAFALHMQRAPVMPIREIMVKALDILMERSKNTSYEKNTIIETANAFSYLLTEGFISVLKVRQVDYSNYAADKLCGFTIPVMQDYLVASCVAKDLIALSQQDGLRVDEYLAGVNSVGALQDEDDIFASPEPSSRDTYRSDTEDEAEIRLPLLSDEWWQTVFLYALEVLLENVNGATVMAKVFKSMFESTSHVNFLIEMSSFMRYLARVGGYAMIRHIIDILRKECTYPGNIIEDLFRQVDSSDGLGMLHVACMANQERTVHVLLALIQCLPYESRIRIIMQKSRYGDTALSICAEQGFLHCMQLLIDSGADIHAALNDSGVNALYLACFANETSCAQVLLQEGANANSMVEDVSCLFHSCYRGNTELCHLLLEYGADPRACSNGLTLLDIASQEEHWDIGILLKDHIAKYQAN